LRALKKRLFKLDPRDLVACSISQSVLRQKGSDQRIFLQPLGCHANLISYCLQRHKVPLCFQRLSCLPYLLEQYTFQLLPNLN